MKKLCLILSLFLITKWTIANEIDRLITTKEVQKFLNQKVYKDQKLIALFTKELQDTSVYGKNKFFKLDLDGNGLTDLLINGIYLLAITDEGNAKYKSHLIDRGPFLFSKFTLVNIIHTDEIPLLVVNTYNADNTINESNRKPDTLILKFGDFVEYCVTSKSLNIKEINFSTSACFGTCPVFALRINKSGGAEYDASKYNKTSGKFRTTIDTLSMHRLLQTIDYIKIFSLENKYAVGWTDDQTVYLKIELEDGQTKKINDYGAIGTFGLKSLYNQLFSLRVTQNWKQAN